MFHRFDQEFDRTEPVLVSATRFSYAETPIVTQLTGVEQIGYSYENGQYKQKQLPPLEPVTTVIKKHKPYLVRYETQDGDKECFVGSACY